jgi:hypothetical protein
VELLGERLLEEGGGELGLVGEDAAVDHAVADDEDAELIRVGFVGGEVVGAHRVVVVVDVTAEAAAVLVGLEEVLDLGVGHGEGRVAEAKVEAGDELGGDEEQEEDEGGEEEAAAPAAGAVRMGVGGSDGGFWGIGGHFEGVRGGTCSPK